MVGGVVCQAGMVGSGVETRGRGDEFACVFHAQEHFASGFVVVAGGGEDGFDGVGGETMA